MYRKVIPKTIGLETSSVCQLKCPCCPTASGEIKEHVGYGHLKFENFKKIVDENSMLKDIELSNLGEILLNPEFLDIIKYAFEKKVKVRADNGVNLNNVKDDFLEGIVKYKFRSMVCSIDGATQHSYQIYRVKGNFDTVINNIKKINHYKKLHKSEFPVLTWQYVVFGHNENEILKAKKMAEQLNMIFQPKLSWDPDFSPVNNIEFVKKEIGSKYASRKEFEIKNEKDYVHKICHQLWEKPHINWDGKILGCCVNYWGDFGDDVFKNGLITSINSDKMNYAKEMLMGNKPAKEEIPCSVCDNYKIMKESGKWLRRGFFRYTYIIIFKVYQFLKPIILKLKKKMS